MSSSDIGQRAREITDKVAGIANQSTAALFVVVALFLIIVIVVYIVYKIKRSDLQNVVIVKESTRLFNMKQPLRIDSALLPPTLNGQEYTFSTWLYLVEYPPMDSHALLFCRGGSGQSVNGSNPIVFLNKGTNRLHVAVKTTLVPETPSDLDPQVQGNAILDKVMDPRNGYLTATIDYVPLQRWVHIAFVIQDNLLTLYLDGDIYTVSNVFDLPRRSPTTPRPIFAGTNGDIYVGALPNLTAQPRAFIAKTQYFNFGLMHKDIKATYTAGPTMNTILSALGLNYGLRSPVYRLEA